MELLNNAKSVLGMDEPYNTMFYRDVPELYKISNFLTIPLEMTLTNAIKTKLLNALETFYYDFEVCGQTLEDFKRIAQNTYNLNGETFERVLSVYDDDIAFPILGRVETVTYDVTDKEINSNTRTENLSAKSNTIETPNLTDNSTIASSESDITSDTPSYDLPTKRSEVNENISRTGTNSSNTTNTGENTIGDIENKEYTKKGSITTELSDLGVRPNYESLNGFIDNNRTAEKLFITMFRDCFTLNRCYIW